MSTTLKHINFLLLVIILARVSMRDLKLTRLKAEGFLNEKLCLKNAKSPMHFCPKARCIVFEGTVASYFFFYCYMKLDDFLILFPHF